MRVALNGSRIEFVESARTKLDLTVERVVPHFVDGNQAVMNEKGGVFHSLRHDSTGELLPSHDEVQPGVAFQICGEREFAQENFTEEIPCGAADGLRRCAITGSGQRLLKKDPILRPQSHIAIVGPVDRKACGDFLEPVY